jgi:hypothetical protein
MNRENVIIRNTEYKSEFNIQYILMETICAKTLVECMKFIFKTFLLASKKFKFLNHKRNYFGI